MTPLERGIYRELLDAHYASDDGTLPDDDELLCGLAGVTPSVWNKVKNKILRWIPVSSPGKRQHPRVQAEWAKAVTYRDEQRRRSAKGNQARWRKDPVRDAVPDPLPSPSPSPCKNQISDSSSAPSEQIQNPHPPSGGLPGFDHLGTIPASSSSSPSSVSETSTSKAKGLHPLAVAWNEAVVGTKLPKVTKMTGARSSQIKARLADEPDFAVWQRAFKAIVQSKFHRGVNERGWTATFDYAMQAKSCGPWLDAARLEVSEPKPDPAAPLPDMAEREARYRANMARFAASGVGK
jgi:uncharacterized protein YdaU (DUF1376 family)